MGDKHPDFKRSQIVQKELKKCHIATENRIAHCFALERREPFTSNRHGLSTYKAKYIEKYKTARREYLEAHPTAEATANTSNIKHKALENYIDANLSRYKTTLLQLMSRDQDDADDIIDMMAEIRAYYQGVPN